MKLIKIAKTFDAYNDSPFNVDTFNATHSILAGNPGMEYEELLMYIGTFSNGMHLFWSEGEHTIAIPQSTFRALVIETLAPAPA